MKVIIFFVIYRWDGGEVFKVVVFIFILMEGVSYCCSNYFVVYFWMEGMSDCYCYYYCIYLWVNKREGCIGFFILLCCGC